MAFYCRYPLSTLTVALCVLVGVREPPRACAAQPAGPEDETPAAARNPAGPAESKTEPESEPEARVKLREVEAELSGEEAKQVLERLAQASQDARRKPRSAVACGTFERWEQHPGDANPRQLVNGRIATYYDDGKEHIRLSYEKRLQKTTYMPENVLPSRKPGEEGVYRDKDGEGEIAKVVEKYADWKPDSVYLLNDGKNTISIENTTRIRPHGYERRTHRDMREALGWFDIDAADPACLALDTTNVAEVIANRGPEAITIFSLKGGGYRGTFRIRNAPRVRVEFDCLPEDEFNVSSYRAFNDAEEEPASALHASWRKVDDHWLVTRLSRENRLTLKPGHVVHLKRVLESTSFRVDPWVDPLAFRLEALDDGWLPRTGLDDAPEVPPNPKIAALRRRLDALLAAKLETVDWMCGLSGTQRQRLELAGRGDVERVVGAVSPAPQSDAEVLPALRMSRTMFDDGSLFERIQRKALTEAQASRSASFGELVQEIERAGGRVAMPLRDGGPSREVRLTATSWDDERLSRLADATNLQLLNLDGTKVTDAGLVHLSRMTLLQSLDLSATRITDAGLVHLKPLTSLKQVNLTGTEVTDVGIAELKRMLPNAQVRW